MGERDYSRLAPTAFARERIAGLTALVVGAGALGNEVVKNLALLGVGRIWVLDRDHVELSNLTRSVLFCIPDIAAHIENRTPKAVLVARRAREINPDITAVPFVGEIADFGLGYVRRADVVFSCLDNEMARLELGWACTRLDRLLVDGGLGLRNHSSGQVSVFPGAGGPCYACRKSGEQRSRLLQELQGREDPCWLKERATEEQAAVATTPLMASVVAALQVELGLRGAMAPDRARDRGVAYRVMLNPEPGLERMAFERSPNCPLHEAESVFSTVTESVLQARTATPAALLDLCAPDGVINLDWPLTAVAECPSCSHRWEPLVRRARFRGSSCARCGAADPVELEVLSTIDRASPWAARTFEQLGLPAGDIFEIAAGSDMDSSRVHVELTGDLAGVAAAGVA